MKQRAPSPRSKSRVWQKTNFQHPFSIFNQISNFGYESDQLSKSGQKFKKNIPKGSSAEELEDPQSFC